jgi:hypothetical protein
MSRLSGSSQAAKQPSRRAPHSRYRRQSRFESALCEARTDLVVVMNGGKPDAIMIGFKQLGRLSLLMRAGC